MTQLAQTKAGYSPIQIRESVLHRLKIASAHLRVPMRELSSSFIELALMPIEQEIQETQEMERQQAEKQAVEEEQKAREKRAKEEQETRAAAEMSEKMFGKFKGKSFVKK